jgi:hypothetical protein
MKQKTKNILFICLLLFSKVISISQSVNAITKPSNTLLSQIKTTNKIKTRGWVFCSKRTVNRRESEATSCGSNQYKSAALCYPNCEPNYTGVGPVCWEICRSGYTDTGAFCQTWPDTYGKGCCCTIWGCCGCRSGYTDNGCTCGKSGSTYAKGSYGNGAGYPLQCEPGQEQELLKCYDPCPAGYTRISASQCVKMGCPTQFPIDCGSEKCINSSTSCTSSYGGGFGTPPYCDGTKYDFIPPQFWLNHEIVAFKSNFGKFLCAEQGGLVIADRSVQNVWEEFKPYLIDSNGGWFALQTYHLNYLVLDGEGLKLENVTSAGYVDKFKFQIYNKDGKVYIKASNGKLCSVQEGTNRIECNRTEEGAWEQFSPK